MQKPSVSYSFTIRAEYPNYPGMLGKITSAIGHANGDVTAVDVILVSRGIITRDFTVNTLSSEHGEVIVSAVSAVPEVNVRTVSDATFLVHLGGKIGMHSIHPVATRDDMSKVYTPGVGRVCMAIHNDPKAAWALTGKGHTVAVVSDGSAVLGLGNIGPKAALPVMEGKALLFKEFGGIDAWPIVLDTQDPDEIITIVQAIAPGFGGINLEDISAPRCFYIEEKLKEQLDIPVFHDDQHGTAVVVLAGLINALKLTDRKPESLRTVIAGTGAAGVACTRILLKYGVKDIIAFDRTGAISRNRTYNTDTKQWVAENTNPSDFQGSMSDALKGADFFLGLAGPDLLTTEMVSQMTDNSILFALSNPVPEIMPEYIPSNVGIIATGRTDYANQVNNSLCFPGLFKGVLQVRASDVNDQMKIAAAHAIANIIPEHNLLNDFIIPSVFDSKIATNVARAVAEAAYQTGVARRTAVDQQSYATRRVSNSNS